MLMTDPERIERGGSVSFQYDMDEELYTKALLAVDLIMTREGKTTYSRALKFNAMQAPAIL